MIYFSVTCVQVHACVAMYIMGFLLVFSLQRYALKMEDILLETAGRCRAVICCRVTPLQKVHIHVYT